MPPIPIHASDPINKNPTPQTSAAPQPDNASLPPSTPASTTQPSTTTSYPAAKPGTAAFPAPTGSVARPPPPRQPSPTRTIAPSAADPDMPPAPQPGAVPVALSQPVATPTTTVPSSVAANRYAPPGVSAASPAPPQAYPSAPPPQYSYAPPSQSYTATRSTTTFQPAPPSASSPFQLPATNTAYPNDKSRASIEHPAGYVQNPMADALPASSRAAQTQQADANTSIFDGMGIGSALHNAGYARGEARKDGGGSGSIGAWDAMGSSLGSWLGELKKGLQKGEAEVWKKIGGKDE